VLESWGLDAPHEREGRDGVVSWCLAAGHVPLPSWHEPVTSERFDLVLHQVRNPIDTIASLTTMRADSMQWAAQSVEIDLSAPKLVQALAYWVEWNKLAEATAQITYRVEDIPSDLPRRNQRQHPDVEWWRLEEMAPKLAMEAQEMGRRYGYNTQRGSR
jgi:hypothetical protein